MALGDIINKAGSAPGVAPIAPPPTPVQDDPAPLPSVDEIDPKDVEARRAAELREAQPKPPEQPIPEEFAPRVVERESTFDDADADEFDAVEEDIEPDMPPAAYDDAPANPFKAPTAPPAPAPTPNLVSDDKDSAPVDMDWLNPPIPGRDSDSAAPAAAPSPAASYDSFDDTDDGYDDADYSGGSDRADFIKAKTAGLLEKPKEIFQKHPRPVIFGGIGLVVALVMVFAFGGGSPMPPPAPETAPVEPVMPVGEGDNVGTPVTLFPTKVSANCGAGQTSPALAFNNNPGDAWICPRANGIDGAVLNIVFERTVQVLSVTVSPGYNYVAPNGKDHWNEHRVVTQILWRAGGKQFVHKINPSRSGSTFTFNPPKGIPTTTMSLTIQRTERPDAAGAEVNPETGEGGLLPPLGGGGGPEDTEVDKSVAINSIIITGYELG